MTSSPRGLRIPHPLVLLSACSVLAALASWVLPAGRFDVVALGTVAIVAAITIGLA